MFVLNLVVQVAAFIWLLSKMQSNIEKLKEDIVTYRLLPERVSKLEWENTNIKDDLKEIKESGHKINGKLNDIALTLHALTREGDKHQREGERKHQIESKH